MHDEKASPVRMLGYVAGVLRGQQDDPLCRECRAYASTFALLSERSSSLESSEMPEDMKDVLSNVEDVLGSVVIPPEPKPQRKLGNCRLPGRKCLVKHSKAVFEWSDESEQKRA
jgi:hypothetical protein